MSIKAKSSHKLYNTWKHMKDRCYNPNNHAYPSYGGRNITVCDRWRDSFESFVFDMGDKPDVTYSIDRIDNDGDYTPKNCRWATRKEQARNTRQSKFVDYKGRRWLAQELAEANNIDPNVFVSRLGIMSVDRALSLPEKRKKGYTVTAYGKTLTINQWADELGLSPSTIARRLDKYTPEKALDKNGTIRVDTIVNKRGVEQLTKEGEHIQYFCSLSEAGRITGINFKNIQTVCKGLRHKAGGFKWSYA